MFANVTVPPAATRTDDGENARPAIPTVAVAGAVLPAEPPVDPPVEPPADPPPAEPPPAEPPDEPDETVTVPQYAESSSSRWST
ncbi:MAG TPA: hypothetical protein VF519_17035 [Mycobacteriales bacterium]